jgi:hypothetical protein
MTRTRLEILQWFALFGGPLAWATQHVVGYGISDAGCHVAGTQWDLHASLLQIVVAAALGSVVLAAEAAALVVFRATKAVGKDEPGPEGRLHFFAQAALLGNALFFVIVLLNTIGSVYHLPCGQA